MRQIRVLLDLVPFLSVGMSFDICKSRRVWPPLDTFHAFIDYGVDDVDHPAETFGMGWDPFRLSAEEYRDAVACIDEHARFDDLGAEPGDWREWFERAVALPRHEST